MLPEPIEVLVVTPLGGVIKLVGAGQKTGQVHQRVLHPNQLKLLEATPEREPFDGDPARFRLGVEAARLGLAYEYESAALSCGNRRRASPARTRVLRLFARPAHPAGGGGRDAAMGAWGWPFDELRTGFFLEAAVRIEARTGRGPLRLIAFVTDSGSVTRILAYLGVPTRHPPPAGRPRSFLGGRLGFQAHSCLGTGY